MNTIYDNENFFNKYSQMTRSQKGLAGTGEWHTLQKLLPDFTNKTVLDLGCGYGWHCLYAAEHGAKAVTGVDLSEKMLAVAKEKTAGYPVNYLQADIATITFPVDTFDVVLSSLAIHYVADFDNYFNEGLREANFLGEKVTKYHRTLTTYLNTLLENDFTLLNVVEPTPAKELLALPEMKEELRRPMMLIIKAKNNLQ